MPMIQKLPSRVQITCSPDELRKLADKMDAKIAKTTIGQDTLVEVWTVGDLELLFYFDQEKAASAEFIDMIPERFQAGMILSHHNRAYEIVRTEYSKADKGYWVWVKGEKEPLFCGQMAFYKVKRCGT